MQKRWKMTQLNRIKEAIQGLIDEHRHYGYCTDWQEPAMTVIEDVYAALNQAYDVGRYEALKRALYIIDEISSIKANRYKMYYFEGSLYRTKSMAEQVAANYTNKKIETVISRYTYNKASEMFDKMKRLDCSDAEALIAIRED